MARKSQNENHPRQLLVEGIDDFAVVLNVGLQKDVLKSALDNNLFKILKKGGKQKLLPSIAVTFKTEGLKRLGAIVDSDQDVAASWNAVRDRFSSLGYANIPQNVPVEGWISAESSSERPRVGAWLMPNNQDIGALEDFLLREISEDCSLLSYVKETLNSLEAQSFVSYSPNDRSKAEVHTWLAWQREPGLQLGTAIKAKVLTPSSDTAVLFTRWLEKLFLED